MRKRLVLERRKLISLICLLLAVTIGIGYAVLSQQLKVNGSVNYDTMAWDVGFSAAYDGGGTVSSNPEVSSDKKSISISCDLGTSLAQETCIAKAKIKNGSSFAVQLDESPLIEYDNTYINSVDVVWTDIDGIVKAFDEITTNSEKEIKVTILTKELNADMLPENGLSLPITITMNWVESQDINVSFEDKTAVFFGDSVAYGYSTSGNGFGYYVNQINKFKSFTNAAVNTATLNTTTQGSNNVIEQINKNKSKSFDYVIIEGGYGDLRDTPPLGTLTSGYEDNFDTTTFAGAVEKILYLVTTTWKDARIGYIISYDTPNSNQGIRPNHAATKEYWDVVKAACDKWDVDYLDFFEGSTNYNGEIKTYSELFDVDGNRYLAADNIHPTAAGYEFITIFIEKWMKTLSVQERDFIADTEIEDELNANPTVPSGITVVNSFNDLVFVKDYSIGGVSTGTTAKWIETLGRSSAVNYYVKVNGGETIGLSSVATGVSYAIFEMKEDTLYSGGQGHSSWLTTNVTLNANTKYIAVSFKNGDGNTSFTNEQLALLPTYLEFK